MTGSIGVGLFLNVVFWTVAVLVAVGLAALAVIEWFPGREPEARGVPGASRGEGQPADSRKPETGEGGSAGRYRKAS